MKCCLPRCEADGKPYPKDQGTVFYLCDLHRGPAPLPWEPGGGLEEGVTLYDEDGRVLRRLRYAWRPGHAEARSLGFAPTEAAG